MVEEDFFTKNYKKSENSGHFEFITKASIWALIDQCAMKNSPDLKSLYFPILMM